MYGAFGHSLTEVEWLELLDKGPKDPDIWKALDQYLECYEDRFDLVDPEKPFMQVAGLHTAKDDMKGLDWLVLDMPAGMHLFTTRTESSLQRMSMAEAARWLVTIQAFDVSGIKSGAIGDPRVKGGKGYPIGTAWCGNLGGLLNEGSNLWETLMYNFVSDELFDTDEENVDWSDDRPVWERAPLTAAVEKSYNQPQADTGIPRYFKGPATLCTWQSRRIRLAHDGEYVTGVLLCNGDRLKPQNAQGYETMTAWRRSEPQEKALKQPVVYMPRRHDPTRSLWRNLPALTVAAQEPDAINATLRPRSLDWLEQVMEQDQERGESTRPMRLHAYGVQYGNQEAVIEAMVDDALDLDLCLLTAQNPFIGQELAATVNLVDEGISALANLASNIAMAASLDPEGPRAQARERGYSSFDGVFRQWLRHVNLQNFDEEILRWRQTVRQLLLRLGIEQASLAPQKAIVGREISRKNNATGEEVTTHYSVALAEIWFRAKVNTIIPKEGE
ncbi:type I-E CRISPR-associated protein Cse1/CasA [Bifidobacterium cuniculi]|uniref:type I-E CRISPR-associated protein Cse1/CasA n=1 Tax=Bifidobacterium cuniculi TaxID=1688 RepID=UPI001EE683CE|nr:type I-E CRISPR-associated protein Cse1/CasA [Bifidobacterium cuniculi]